MLVSLRPPYKSISRNTIGRITRDALAELGVDTSMWGPHSTRGAFVKFYKSLELPSEVVAEIGQWANLEAFAKHYLRLGAADEAASKLWKFVHTASRGPWCCGDSSPTPQEPVSRGGEEEEHAKHQGHIESRGGPQGALGAAATPHHPHADCRSWESEFAKVNGVAGLCLWKSIVGRCYLVCYPTVPPI